MNWDYNKFKNLVDAEEYFDFFNSPTTKILCTSTVCIF
jgi:hypothetical protein